MRLLESTFPNPNTFHREELARDQPGVREREASSPAGAGSMKWVQQGVLEAVNQVPQRGTPHSNHPRNPKGPKPLLYSSSNNPNSINPRSHNLAPATTQIKGGQLPSALTQHSVTIPHFRETRRDVWGTPPQRSSNNRNHVWSHPKHSIP